MKLSAQQIHLIAELVESGMSYEDYCEMCRNLARFVNGDVDKIKESVQDYRARVFEREVA